MEPKKTSRANLESRRKSFFLTGLIFALAASLVAFEWTTYYQPLTTPLPGKTEVVWVEEIPPTKVMVEQLAKPKQGTKVVAKEKPAEPNPKEEKLPNDGLPDLSTLGLNLEGIETIEFEEIENIDPFAIIEEMPSFKGGEEARIKFLRENIKLSGLQIGKKIEGTVYVEFIVEKNGRVTNVKIKRGVHPEVDAIVLAAAKKMPKWNPGEQRSHKVRAGLVMPVKINLQ